MVVGKTRTKMEGLASRVKGAIKGDGVLLEDEERTKTLWWNAERWVRKRR